MRENFRRLLCFVRSVHHDTSHSNSSQQLLNILQQQVSRLHDDDDHNTPTVDSGELRWSRRRKRRQGRFRMTWSRGSIGIVSNVVFVVSRAVSPDLFPVSVVWVVSPQWMASSVSSVSCHLHTTDTAPTMTLSPHSYKTPSNTPLSTCTHQLTWICTFS